MNSVESLQFELNTIRVATSNFSTENKLGEGGFGHVYKGKLESGQEIAVKRQSKTFRQGVAEFKTEVVLVAKLQHKNLVKLLGFCLESEERILVYEYLPNSSLDKFLSDPMMNPTLDWQTRLKIIIGIARGLLYLHEDSRLKVINRDLKTSNILLDQDMNPKISDFGLAKLFGVDQTQGDTNRIVGTYASAGRAADVVYGLFMCRGDQNTSECRECVATAVRDHTRTSTCPRSKEDTIFYDECMLRYDNQTLDGKMETWPGFLMSNPQNITGNQNQFEELIENTTNLLATKAATGNGKKYATTAVEFRSFKTLYGLEQCTPDLTDDSCFRCLNNAIGMLQIRQGARVLLPSCNIRYETYPFFQGADNLLSPPPPLPPPMATANPPSIVLPKDGNKKVSSTVIIAIVTPIATIAVALLILGICLIKRKAKKVRSNVVDHTTTGEDFTTTESIQYDLDMLQSATNNFSDQNKLGEGGFGAVYKGTLTNGQKIAVKKLATRSSQGVREFKNEALLVAKLQHRNLVKLLGFCLAGEEKLLVYEYVLNKSLDCFLFDPEKQGQLDWRMRYNIIQGIARGMLYLHQDSRLTIIHRDLKASNILLDRNMNPKIADFGIARIFGVDQTQENTSRIVGTYGYMAPEYAMQGQFSTKSDVYSFGVLVLEIISGKRNTSFYQSDDGEDLISYAWKQWKERSPMNLADPNIRHSCSNNELMRCIHLGLLCVQESINDRPTMATIVLTLDSNSVTLPVPEQPIFTVKSRSVSSFPKETGSDEQSSNKSAPWSVNDVSITEPEPR